MECSESSVSVVKAPGDSSLTLNIEAAGDTTELDRLRWFAKISKIGFVGGNRHAGAGIPDDGEVLAERSGVGNGVAKTDGGLGAPFGEACREGQRGYGSKTKLRRRS